MLQPEAVKVINGILEQAAGENRNTLYEHEIYGILKESGLKVPHTVFIADLHQITPDLLQGFGQTVMIKVVSPQIAHKQVVGGVKKVKNEDPLFIQFILQKMKEEIFSKYPGLPQPEIKGFLIAEFIPHTQALGYEVLIGFREDKAFGPVITLSKGGDDAEFFAKYFDPANLFLPPLDPDAARAMLQSLNIRHKYRQIGHPEYIELMAETTAVLSQLAYEFSFINPVQPRFIFKSFEVNPFVFAEDGRFVAIDGFAEFETVNQKSLNLPKIHPTGLESFFHPSGVAVIGVSGDLNKYSLGREIADSLHDMGRQDLYLVNARGGELEIGGTRYPLYQKIQDIPGPVDLIVYAAPAQHTIDFIAELSPDSAKAIILISGIPAEMNYSDFASQLELKLPPGIRVIGPNCMGVYNAPSKGFSGLNTLFIEEKRLEIKHSEKSNVVLLTQSGALGVTAIDKLQNTRILKSLVSFGNKFDVKITDLLAYHANDPSVEVIAIYIEGLGLGEGRGLFQLSREIDKPLIMYKAGKTEAGARAAASHTASMSGSYEVFQAACGQAGVILAENIEDYYNYIKAFSLLAVKKPRGNRVAGVVNAGFESTVGADELQHLTQAQLSPETIERLNRINQYGLVDTHSPFLDITPMADDRMYAEFVQVVMEDEGVDCVFVAVVPHAVSLKTTPDTCYDPGSLANRLVNLSKQYRKPLVISVNAGRYYQDFVSIMEINGLPVYNDIRSAIKSLDVFVRFNLR